MFITAFCYNSYESPFEISSHTLAFECNFFHSERLNHGNRKDKFSIQIDSSGCT